MFLVHHSYTKPRQNQLGKFKTLSQCLTNVVTPLQRWPNIVETIQGLMFSGGFDVNHIPPNFRLLNLNLFSSSDWKLWSKGAQNMS